MASRRAATLAAIHAHLAEGGSLRGWCRAHDVRFAEVYAWIQGDEALAKQYAAAKEARLEAHAEHVNEAAYELSDVDLAEAYDARGRLKPLHQMPRALRRAITAIEYDEDGNVAKIKFVDQLRAAEFLAKLRRMLVERVEHEGKVTLEELVGGSMPGEGAPTP